MAAAALFLFFQARSRAHTKDARRAWRRTAEALGLSPGGGPFENAREGAGSDLQWHGRIDGSHLLLEERVGAAAYTSIRIRGGLPKGLALDRRSDEEGPRERGGGIGDNAFDLLGTGRYGDAARAQAVTLGLKDPDVDIRCLTAALGNEIAALATLACERCVPTLARRLDHPNGLVAARATLGFLLAQDGERSWPWQTSLAQALGRCPVPGAENSLIARLAIPDDDLRTAAVEALGTIGTVAAVAALVPLRDALLPSKLKSLARDTILGIQARAGSPDRGALALVDDAANAGALALADER